MCAARRHAGLRLFHVQIGSVLLFLQVGAMADELGYCWVCDVRRNALSVTFECFGLQKLENLVFNKFF